MKGLGGRQESFHRGLGFRECLRLPGRATFGHGTCIHCRLIGGRRQSLISLYVTSPLCTV